MNQSQIPDLEPDQIGEAIRAFGGENCPFCEVEKDTPIKPFCDECLEQLSPSLLEDIWNRETYLHTFHPAMEHLKKVSKARPSENGQPENQTSAGAPAKGKHGG